MASSSGAGANAAVRPREAGPTGPDDKAYYRDVRQGAIEETEAQLARYVSLQQDYEGLKGTLQTLPDKTEHDVMVPIGKHAFFPGQLVHTNEIMVLLGDNYFIERSARQATSIAERRLKTVEEMVGQSRKALDNILASERFTDNGSEYAQLPKEGLHAPHEGEFEIREELDSDGHKAESSSEEEEDIKYGYGFKRPPVEEQPLTESVAAVETDKGIDDLMARLLSLEREEAELRELEESEPEEEDIGVWKGTDEEGEAEAEAEAAEPRESLAGKAAQPAVPSRTIRLQTEHSKRKVTFAPEARDAAAPKDLSTLTPADIAARFATGADSTPPPPQQQRQSVGAPVPGQGAGSSHARSSPFTSTIVERPTRPVTEQRIVDQQLRAEYSNLVMRAGTRPWDEEEEGEGEEAGTVEDAMDPGAEAAYHTPPSISTASPRGGWGVTPSTGARASAPAPTTTVTVIPGGSMGQPAGLGSRQGMPTKDAGAGGQATRKKKSLFMQQFQS